MIPAREKCLDSGARRRRRVCLVAPFFFRLVCVTSAGWSFSRQLLESDSSTVVSARGEMQASSPFVCLCLQFAHVRVRRYSRKRSMPLSSCSGGSTRCLKICQEGGIGLEATALDDEVRRKEGRWNRSKRECVGEESKQQGSNDMTRRSNALFRLSAGVCFCTVQ